MRIDYQVIRGDDRTIQLELADGAGTPLSLTGATVRFIVDDLFSTTATLDESAGEALVTVAAEDTEGAPDIRAVYRYNVKVTASDGDVSTPQRGLFIVLPNVLDNV